MMSFVRTLLLGSSLAGMLLVGVALPAQADSSYKISGTRFDMDVPNCWHAGYKDTDKLFMIFFKDPKSGAGLEGVYLRGNQPTTFTLADFTKARISGEDKRYEGKDHKVAKQGDLSIAGEKGSYLQTSWKDGRKNMEKHTVLLLKNGQRYLVVMSGEKGKVNKKVFDNAVKTFALVTK